MSWDIFIQDLPASAERVADIPDSFFPRSMGRRAEIAVNIGRSFLDSDFTDPSYGFIRRPGYQIDVALGSQEDVIGITLRVSGSREVVGALTTLIRLLGHRAIDSLTSEIFDPSGIDESYERWRAQTE